MPDGDLRQLAEVEEISIGFTRPDGSTGSTPVWVVQAGDAIFVRSLRGRGGGWSRRLRANPDSGVGNGAHTYPVRARPVGDAGTVEAVTGARVAGPGRGRAVGASVLGVPDHSARCLEPGTARAERSAARTGLPS
jgi:hypothetical protein